MNKDSKIFVAGHRGLVGSAIVRTLKERGYVNILTATRDEVDLVNQQQVENFFAQERPEYVFDAAARVGGIYANDYYSGEFIYQNMQIQTNLIHCAWKYEVQKFLFLGSVCIYPKFAEVPVKEESLLTGYLELMMHMPLQKFQVLKCFKHIISNMGLKVFHLCLQIFMGLVTIFTQIMGTSFLQ